jgi:hypothetical protein
MNGPSRHHEYRELKTHEHIIVSISQTSQNLANYIQSFYPHHPPNSPHPQGHVNIHSPMAAKKDPPPRREKIPFIEDSILKETVKKEMRYQRAFTEFHPSVLTLDGATPDKPLIDSYASRLYSKRDEEDDVERELRTTLGITSRTLEPRHRFRDPMTTSMDYGWDQATVPQFRSMFDHRRKSTEITQLPSKWDPNANVMTVKDKPPK